MKRIGMIVLMAVVTAVSVAATPAEEAERRNFLGTSAFMVASFIPDLDVIFYEIDYGRRLREGRYFLAGAHVYRIDAPMSATDGVRYPGRVYTYGPIVGFQYLRPSGIFISQLVNPMILDYRDRGDDGIGTGYMVLLATRAGYHLDFSIGGVPFYFEAAAEFNFWPWSGGAPAEFRDIDTEYPRYCFAPALNTGIRF